MEKSENVAASTYVAFKLLYLTFVMAPILAGLDKFFNILTYWPMYLSPLATKIIPFPGHVFMRAVGIVEIGAGIIVALKPRIGGLIVSLWLLVIIINLLLAKGFYDIALRDLGLCLGAASLALLSRECCKSR